VHRVTVIIPHWNGEGILRRCLVSLRRTRGVRFEVVVVDNASTDRSPDMVRREFPGVRMVRSPVNLGFAGGCNLGIGIAASPYLALLNNDAVVTPGWLQPLVEAMDADPGLAAVQPKLRSLRDPGRFDYAGAAGGEMDLFGFPFAAGRVFDTVERDSGQYDAMRPCFWASGAATVLRRSALRDAGIFDESFFAHMEEIDLDWRLQRAGYRIAVVPQSMVFHESGGTLAGHRFRKMVLNHRNSIWMLLKNLPGAALVWILPLRILLEVATLAGALCTGQWKRAAAVPAAFAGALRGMPSVVRWRKRCMALRGTGESILLHRLYRGSIVIDYFLRGRREYGMLGPGHPAFLDRPSETGA
jgi:GT2 family glycosyltransferase